MTRFFCLLPINEALTTPRVTTPTNIVETAFISGVTPSLTIEYIFIGRVVDPGPDVKLAMTKSSSDKVKDSNQPAITAGRIIGRVININVLKGVHPKSSAASDMLSS